MTNKPSWLPGLILGQLIKFLFLIFDELSVECTESHIPRRSTGLSPFARIFINLHGSSIFINLSRFSIVSFHRIRFGHDRFPAQAFSIVIRILLLTVILVYRPSFFHCFREKNQFIRFPLAPTNRNAVFILDSVYPVFTHNIISLFYGSGFFIRFSSNIRLVEL